MKCTHIPTLKDLARHQVSITREELDHARRQTGLEHDVVEEPARVDGTRAGLPNYDVADNKRRNDQVDGEGCEVEGCDSVDEAV